MGKLLLICLGAYLSTFTLLAANVSLPRLLGLAWLGWLAGSSLGLAGCLAAWLPGWFVAWLVACVTVIDWNAHKLKQNGFQAKLCGILLRCVSSFLFRFFFYLCVCVLSPFLSFPSYAAALCVGIFCFYFLFFSWAFVCRSFTFTFTVPYPYHISRVWSGVVGCEG